MHSFSYIIPSVVLALLLGGVLWRTVRAVAPGLFASGGMAAGADVGLALQAVLVFEMFAVGGIGILACLLGWVIDRCGEFTGFCVMLIWLGAAYVFALNLLFNRPRRAGFSAPDPVVPGKAL